MALDLNHKARSLKSKGLSALRAGDTEDALSYFEEALALGQLEATLAQEIERLLQEAYKQAGVSSASSGNDPQRTQANMSKGLSALRAGDYDDALKFFESAIDEDPTNQHAISMAAETRRKRKEVTSSAGATRLRIGWIAATTIIGLLIAITVLGMLKPDVALIEPTPSSTTTAVAASNPPVETSQPPTPIPTPIPIPVIPSTLVTQLPTVITSGVVTSNGLNLRSGPGTNYPLKYPGAKLGKGARVEILNSNKGEGCRSADNTWYQIQLPDGTPSWVCAAFIRIE